MAKFCKRKRDAKLFLSDEWREWRLASVGEVNENLAEIRKMGILNSWDTARLLNGYARGKSTAVKQYRPNIEDMLLIKTDVSRSSDGSFPETMYPQETTEGAKWTRKGGIAAILLSSEDKISEAICFVLYGIVQKEANVGKRVEELNKLTECLHENFHNRRTVLHYAVDQPHNQQHGVYVTRCLKNNFEAGKDLIKAPDIYGRTALHFAAFHGNIDVCKILIEECKIGMDETDINKENVLHFAVKGEQGELLNYLCGLSEAKSIINSPDAQGRTSLHKAAAQGSTKMIATLLSSLSKPKDKELLISLEYLPGQLEGRLQEDERSLIRQPDLFGQTALLEAARGGHVKAVKLLLENGSRPLHERNSDGRSALHYAVQLSSQNEAEELARLLLEYCESDEERSLLLWASATGSGTAEEASPKSSKVKKYLKAEKERTAQSSKDLLSSAIELQHEKMAWELVTRCADTTFTKEIAKCNCRCEKQRD